MTGKNCTKHELRTPIPDISADVSLLRLRTVRVYVVGDINHRGAYDVSSLSTPLNALFVAGGVTTQALLRRLQHYRGKQLVKRWTLRSVAPRHSRELQRLGTRSLMVPPLVDRDCGGMVRRQQSTSYAQRRPSWRYSIFSGGILPAAALHHIDPTLVSS